MRLLIVVFLVISSPAFSKDTTKLYNPYANAEKDVAAAIIKAKKEGKNVLIQIGGNWCIPCYRFNAFLLTDSFLKKSLQNNFIVYHLNYSKENTNYSFLKKLHINQQLKFPALIILDNNGNKIHFQDITYLEKGNGYDYEKVKSFLKNWSPPALNEDYHKE